LPTELFLDGKTEQIAQLSKLPPLQRLGQPEDMAGVVSFLAEPDGAWVMRRSCAHQWRFA